MDNDWMKYFYALLFAFFLMGVEYKIKKQIVKSENNIILHMDSIQNAPIKNDTLK